MLATRRLDQHALRHGENARVEGKVVCSVRELAFGDRLLVWGHGRGVVLEGVGRLDIGDDVFINDGVRIVANNHVRIGSGVIIAFDALLLDSAGHGLEDRPVRYDVISVGDGSWIGARALVMPGVHIGRCSVVAAGSVVTRDVPDLTLVAGVPARQRRQLTAGPDGRVWNNLWAPELYADLGRATIEPESR